MVVQDIILKGEDWSKAINLLAKMLPQPNYDVFIMSASIGIKMDKISELVGISDINDGNQKSVPRTVLYQHISDISFLFQTAILTSKTVDYSDEKRTELAFSPDSDNEMNKLEFLTKFANYGVTVLLSKITDDNIENMEKLTDYLISSINDLNIDLDDIDIDNF